MKGVALLYHDVVDDGAWESSGFSGPDANIYKLSAGAFQDHLRAIRKANPNTVLTFDDGGASVHGRVAGLLESNGFKGLFFVATDWIGRPGFLDAQQIRDLRNRGHRIGTHSCSHPARMSHCSWEQLLDEWSRSLSILADILGEPTPLGSVPGGFYSPRVGRAAAAAGITTLFTSEPTLTVHSVGGCAVIGRFMIQQKTTAAEAAALARGDALPRYRQAIVWNCKKAAKAAGGAQWLRLRRWTLEKTQRYSHLALRKR